MRNLGVPSLTHAYYCRNYCRAGGCQRVRVGPNKHASSLKAALVLFWTQTQLDFPPN